MVGVSGSGGSFGCDANADEARQPVGDDGEWQINAHGALYLSQTLAVKHQEGAHLYFN